MEMLNLDFTKRDSFNGRSMLLHEWLSAKRFFLILDDLWEEIDLEKVGIPPYKRNRSKIVITTRLFDVCTDMRADAKIKVDTLTEAEAWDLFAKNVGEVVHLPHIEDITRDIAKECGGLPLSITVDAKAMREQSKKELWEDALRALKASVQEIRGTERYVFRPLKLSYEALEDENEKMCFLYCSLFPEDYEILVGHLVNLWIMEGFVENLGNLWDVSNKGHRIVETLKRRCLLEEGIYSERSVKMHDVIRDLALYIASPACDEGPKFVVRARMGLNVPPPEATWREYDKISLMNNKIIELPIGPECHNLVSLLVIENPRTIVPYSFFELKPTLQVRDLTKTSITSLTISSSSLLLNLRALTLRECKELTELPFLGQLKELQFLDISRSGIRSLPQMQNLVNLKKLNMSLLFDFRTIFSCNVISKLSSTEDLRMMRTEVQWAKRSELAAETNATLEEVEKLKRLTT